MNPNIYIADIWLYCNATDLSRTQICGSAANAGATFIRGPRVPARAFSLSQVCIDAITT